jgi:hypothetical protein
MASAGRGVTVWLGTVVAVGEGEAVSEAVLVSVGAANGLPENGVPQAESRVTKIKMEERESWRFTGPILHQGLKVTGYCRL